MSSSEDVLDNWEEIDDTKLADQIHQIRRDLDITLNDAQENGLPRMMIPTDDYYAPSYTQPPKPVVTILRRPIQQPHEVRPGKSKPKLPIKTLQQREQEYAKARLRILGSAKNPDDELDGSVSQSIVNSGEVSTDNSSNIPTGSDNVPRTPIPIQQRSIEGIIRLPRGPDGSQGFVVRRQ